jgi:hypothetical protein
MIGTIFHGRRARGFGFVQEHGRRSFPSAGGKRSIVSSQGGTARQAGGSPEQ